MTKQTVKTTVTTAVAAATLAAVTAFSAPALHASILSSPANSAQQRIAGVQADMARAVELKQLSPEQAKFLENQLVQRIQNGV